jgi:polar amino acid transport system substrate-binding protein
MKTMRILVLFFVVAGLFAACANMQGQGVVDSSSPVLSRIVERGELVVGTAASMPPLNMTTKGGEIIGFEIDLATAMAGAMGVKPNLVAMPFSDLLPALEAGRVDVILSNMTITGERNRKVAFAGPYFVSGKSFLTKYQKIASATDPSEVNSPATTLAALKGSTSQAFVEELIPKARLVPTKDYDEAVKMLFQDEVDALIADYPICVVSVFRYPEQDLVASVTPLTYEPIGVALPANDPLLVNWVQNFLNAMEGSGALRMLRKRWFEDASWLEKLP